MGELPKEWAKLGGWEMEIKLKELMLTKILQRRHYV